MMSIQHSSDKEKKIVLNSLFNEPVIHILRSRWDLHELFCLCFFVHKFSPTFLMNDFYTCPRPPPSKNKRPSLKVCGFVNCSRVLVRLCCDWSAKLSLRNNMSLNLHKEKV